MKLIISDIDWETDGEMVDLPKTVIINNPDEELIEDLEHRTGAITDYLSDNYGWLVNGFTTNIE